MQCLKGDKVSFCWHPIGHFSSVKYWCRVYIYIFLYPSPWQRGLDGRKPVRRTRWEGSSANRPGAERRSTVRCTGGLTSLHLQLVWAVSGSSATPPHQSKQPKQSVSSNTGWRAIFNFAADTAWMHALLGHSGGERIILGGSAGLTPPSLTLAWIRIVSSALPASA